MALLEALAGTGAPAALQVVIAASTRLKQKSTQVRAAEIAQRYADDRGWSVDELADRTVPSAGFDDDDTLDLPCGEDAKPYVARLDAALAIHLFNPDGRPIKALPAGDDDNTKESKKAFTAAKKELTQIVTLQGERLFEPMCVERQWPVADWLIFRGAAEKRGYQRVMRDSGGCYEYVKTFPSHGITATIWHTGSYAVDENLPLALKELKITKNGHRGPYRLKNVPPVMLAEC